MHTCKVGRCLILKKTHPRIKNIGNIHKEVDKKWVIILFAIVSFLLILFSVVSMWVSTKNDKENLIDNSISNTSNSQELSSNTSSNLNSQGNPIQSGLFSAKVPEREPVDSNYFEDAVFIGDSITVGFGNYGLVPKSNVLADIGINLDTIMNKSYISTSEGRLTAIQSIQQKQPKKIYIMLGSNGIAWAESRVLINKYKEFVNEVKQQSPISTIYICSIPPVTNSKQQSDNRYANSKIASYNKMLLEMAIDTECYFLDSQSVLTDEYGNLSAAIAETDGMHLKMQGYKNLLDYYLKHTIEE